MDVTSEILSRLPVKPLLRLRCVSKHWCALIDSPIFIKLHLNRSNESKNNRTLILNNRDLSVHSLNLDSLNDVEELNHPLKPDPMGIEIVGSCDGLFLLYMKSRKNVVIWNPSTRKHKTLPRTEMEWPRDLLVGYGLGYDSVSDDYKVVRMVQFDNHSWHDWQVHSEVEVYSLKSNNWRRVKDIHYYLSDSRCVSKGFRTSYKDHSGTLHGVFFSGSLHWIGSVNYNDKSPYLSVFGFDNGPVDYNDKDPDLSIIGFDLAIEETQIVPLPEFVDDNFYMKVAVLEGCFCVLAYYVEGHLDVWGMKDYGVKESWNKLFSFAGLSVMGFCDVVRDLRPLAYSKDGREVLIEHSNRKFVWFDIEHNAVKKIMVRGLPSNFDTEVCVQSLVPLCGGSYVDEGDRKKLQRRRQETKKNQQKKIANRRI